MIYSSIHPTINQQIEAFASTKKHTLNAIPEINECTTSFDDSVFIVIPGLHQRKLLVGCIYRSGSMDKAVTSDPKLHSMINKMALNRKFTEVMMVGDRPTISWQPEPHILHDDAPKHPDLLLIVYMTHSSTIILISQPDTGLTKHLL